MYSFWAHELEELRNQENCTSFPDDQREALESVSFHKRRDARRFSKILERFELTRQHNGFYVTAWLEAFAELNRIKNELNNPKLKDQETLTREDKGLIFEGIYRDLGKHLELLSPDADRSDTVEIVTILHAMYSQVEKSYSQADLLHINFNALNDILTHLCTIIKTHPNPLSLLKANKILYTDNFIEHEDGKFMDASLHDAAELFFPKKYNEPMLQWINMSNFSDPHSIIQAIHENEDKMSTARMLANSNNPIDAAKNLLAVKYSSTVCRP